MGTGCVKLPSLLPSTAASPALPRCGTRYGSSVIRIQNVGKTYRAQDGEFHALHDIDLTVAKGEVFGIIGHSGAGKSTLLRLINLLERPTVGHILIEGQDIGRLDEEQLRRLLLVETADVLSL